LRRFQRLRSAARTRHHGVVSRNYHTRGCRHCGARRAYQLTVGSCALKINTRDIFDDCSIEFRLDMRQTWMSDAANAAITNSIKDSGRKFVGRSFPSLSDPESTQVSKMGKSPGHNIPTQ
jgi:hypothetical protein